MLDDDLGEWGCVGFFVLVFVLWAFWFGVPTPWGLFELDLFWPAIRLT